MMIFEFIIEVADVFWSWRVYLCVVPAILLACLLHDKWPEACWLWCLTIPGVLCAFLVGLRWESRSS
jgi:hypothetical protein